MYNKFHHKLITGQNCNAFKRFTIIQGNINIRCSIKSDIAKDFKEIQPSNLNTKFMKDINNVFYL